MEELLGKLEKKLEYCIREELYEEAEKIQAKIKEMQSKHSSSTFSSKRFIDLINEKKTKS